MRLIKQLPPQLRKLQQMLQLQQQLMRAQQVVTDIVLAQREAIGGLRAARGREGARLVDILMERITPLWSRMSFSQKTTARNLFRYKKRFFMTVLGVAGCSFIMGIPGSDDIMLNYQTTSFHDALYARKVLGLRPAPETSPRRLVEWVPWRAAARCATTSGSSGFGASRNFWISACFALFAFCSRSVRLLPL